MATSTADRPFPAEPMYERPGSFDWEVLADADAEYAEWLDARRADDVANIDRDAPPANDNSRSAA